ncbi:hypothetical protein MNKW57_19960 [Biformimicrobium ophioploci]|uniref:Uncharacterized protein n=1 Tax=Biformimicrobium ophioploci TaxID=3036711 RepID=A0ABQ6M015_9GAMM|nr:hypothetical protein MNKW57_19960 [Microbulbifer sp. NKW57]
MDGHKRYGGRVSSGGSGFSKFIDLRALPVIIAFSLGVYLYPDRATRVAAYAMAGTAALHCMFGLLAEYRHRPAMLGMLLVSGVSTAVAFWLPLEFFRGPDLLIIYNAVIVGLVWFQWVKSRKKLTSE